MSSPTLNLGERSRMQRLADFLFEAGMLRKTPRSGYQFLGTGRENVAEHSFRTCIIGYILAKESEADIARTTLLCLFHDFAEARTGDFNYVNRMYNKSDPKSALEHAAFGTGLSGELLEIWDELKLEKSLELGNKYAAKWLEGSLKRLVTDAGKKLAGAIVETDHTDWWYSGPDPDWWVKGE